MSKDEPVSEKALAYIARMFVCEPPCDSYGVCEACIEKHLFLAGYNFGYNAALGLTPMQLANRKLCANGLCIHKEHAGNHE